MFGPTRSAPRSPGVPRRKCLIFGCPRKNALHFREGKHEFQAADWIAIVDFCDEMFFGKTSANNIVSFRPVQQAGTPMDVMMERMDWRKNKSHYTWSGPWKICKTPPARFGRRI